MSLEDPSSPSTSSHHNHVGVGATVEELTTLIEDDPTYLGRLCDCHGRALVHEVCATATVDVLEAVVRLADKHMALHVFTVADGQGHTALHHTLIGGQLDNTKYLLQCKRLNLNLDQVDKEKHSALHWAVVGEDVDAVEMLLKAGASSTLSDKDGVTCLHYCTQLRQSSSTEQILRLLLDSRSAVDAVDNDGRTALLWAATVGSSWAVGPLVGRGAKTDVKDAHGLTVVHCAASRGHVEFIQTLLGLVPDVSVDAMDNHGATPLFYAAVHGQKETLLLLLSHGADVDAQDTKLRTALHCASSRGQLRSIEVLVEHGASGQMQNNKGDLPLHEAAHRGNVDICEYLLDRFPFTATAVNHMQRSALHLAAAAGSVPLCRLLLRHGVAIDQLMIVHTSVMTALDIAAQRKKEDVVDYLRRHGGRLSAELPADVRKSAVQHAVQHTVARQKSLKVTFSKGEEVSTQTAVDVGTTTDDDMTMFEVEYGSEKKAESSGENQTEKKSKKAADEISAERLTEELTTISTKRKTTSPKTEKSTVQSLVTAFMRDVGRPMTKSHRAIRTWSQWKTFIYEHLANVNTAESRSKANNAFKSRLASKSVRNAYQHGDTYRARSVMTETFISGGRSVCLIRKP